MFKTNDIDTSCDVCEYIKQHDWVGPGRHHCRQCHRTWTGSTQVHCVTCHAHFSSPTADDLHRTRDGCQDPSLAVNLKGELRLEARESKYGITWYRRRAVSTAEAGFTREALPVSSPPSGTWAFAVLMPGDFRRPDEGSRVRTEAA